MPVEGKELHSNGLSEDTSTVLRNGGIDGNKIRKNSRNIGDNAKTRVHVPVSLDKCVKLKTSRKKHMQKLTAMKEWLYANNDLPVKELIAKLNKKLIGHYVTLEFHTTARR